MKPIQTQIVTGGLSLVWSYGIVCPYRNNRGINSQYHPLIGWSLPGESKINQWPPLEGTDEKSNHDGIVSYIASLRQEVVNVLRLFVVILI